ncbi:MAG TPA: hypothetical protein VFR19_14075, partial [Hyphomicrobiaceae bacterium]|nr:hypothetical protein [Hyphomicrobiaceae bacterium]
MWLLGYVASRLRSEASGLPNAGRAQAARSGARHYQGRLRLARVDAFLCGWRSKARCLPRNGNATVFRGGREGHHKDAADGFIGQEGSAMKAIIMDRHGGLEVLRYGDLPDPVA